MRHYYVLLSLPVYFRLFWHYLFRLRLYHQGYYEMTPTSALIKPKGRKNELDDKGIFCYYRRTSISAPFGAKIVQKPRYCKTQANTTPRLARICHKNHANQNFSKNRTNRGLYETLQKPCYCKIRTNRGTR